MPLTTLLNTQWVFNKTSANYVHKTLSGGTQVLSGLGKAYSIACTVSPAGALANPHAYLVLKTTMAYAYHDVDWYFGFQNTSGGSIELRYTSDSTYYPATITITGGTDVAEPSVIEWFEANGTNVTMQLVDSIQLNNNLTSVANAIRAKSGGSSALLFPTGFISEIESISPGGGGLWEDVDMQGTGWNLYEIFVILDQHLDQMGATASVTMLGRTFSQEGSGTKYLHFTKVPSNTTVSWAGTGDAVQWCWGKLSTYISQASSSGTGNSSTTAKIASDSDSYSGIMFLMVASPEE